MMQPTPASPLDAAQQSLAKVWGWYLFQRALMAEEKSRVLAGRFDAAAFAVSRYAGKTPEELQQDFEYQTAELGWLTMLGMLAATEAALRVDIVERVRNRKKDEVSRRLRDIGKKRGLDRVRLEEDILDTWKKLGPSAGTKRAVADFKGALHLRHWLAHGRY